MLQAQAIVALVPIILLLICLSIPIVRQLDAQVIRLRGPEVSSPFAYLRTPLLNTGLTGLNGNDPFGLPATTPRPKSTPVPTNERPPPNIHNRRPPKAGNLVVRFDPDHEIRRLEYVTRDGRLATVYLRDRPKQQQQQQPQQQQPQQQQQQQQQQLQQSQVASKSEPQVQIRQQGPSPRAPSVNEPPPRLGQPSGVGQTGGDKNGAPIEAKAQVVTVAGKQKDDPELPVATIDLNESEFERADSLNAESAEMAQKGEILATIAGGVVKNAFQTSGLQLAKAKGIIAKIRSKFAQLPQLIEKNLQAKSSRGKAYIDHESGPQEHPGPTLVYGRIPYPSQSNKQQQVQQQVQQPVKQQQKQPVPSSPPPPQSINQRLDQLDALLRQQQNLRASQKDTPVVQHDNLSPQQLLGD